MTAELPIADPLVIVIVVINRCRELLRLLYHSVFISSDAFY